MSGNYPNKDCVFPFRFNGIKYNSCTMSKADLTENKPWCSTKVDRNGKHVKGNWGSCETNCPSTRNEGQTTSDRGNLPKNNK